MIIEVKLINGDMHRIETNKSIEDFITESNEYKILEAIDKYYLSVDKIVSYKEVDLEEEVRLDKEYKELIEDFFNN